MPDSRGQSRLRQDVLFSTHKLTRPYANSNWTYPLFLPLSFFGAGLLVPRVTRTTWYAITALFSLATIGVLLTRISPALTIGILFVLHLRPLATSLCWFCYCRQSPAPRAVGNLRRWTWQRAAYVLAGPLLVGGVLVCSYDFPGRGVMGWTWQDIGIHSGFSFLGATCFGSLTAVPFWLVLNAVQRSLMKRDDKSPVSDLATMLYSLPRGKVAQTIATLELVIVSPILEEIVYRGFFVFLLGNLVDLANATACFGLLLFVLLHLYQGLHRIPSNVLFFSTAVGLLYSPFGLAGAIGFHIACNLRYALARPYMARQYMASRQLAKVAPALREGRQVTRIGLVPQADADAEKGISPISDK